MRLAVITASAGDTQLACAAVKKLMSGEAKKGNNRIWFMPLTQTAEQGVMQFLEDNDPAGETALICHPVAPEALNKWISGHSIDHAVIGFPSPLDETLSFEMAERLEIPCTLLYEYMFKPEAHAFFARQWIDRLLAKDNCHIAVPLEAAMEDFKKFPAERIHITGHLSVDLAMQTVADDATCAKTRNKLGVSDDDSLVFVSGTTQPHQTDFEFAHLLLSELSTGQYPAIQLRFGLHPGVRDPDEYLQGMLDIFGHYPQVAGQCKIILTPAFQKKLRPENAALMTEKNFSSLLCTNVSGTEAEQAAERVAQAVPGGLLNTGALTGKPAFIMQGRPYLPSALFANNPAAFFNQSAGQPLVKEDLGLDSNLTAGESVVSVIRSRAG